MRLLIAIRLAAVDSSVPEARRIVGDALDRRALGPGVVDDLVLAVSELVSNAVLHGSGADLSLAVRAEPEGFEVSVTSSGSADVGPVHSWSMPPPGSIGGRGLALVRSVVDRVDVATDGDRLTVTVFRAAS